MGHPRAALDADSVREAYRRWAGVYDEVFGSVSGPGRKRAVAAVNGLPGTRVLEVGVGTGLALPLYDSRKRVVGVDLSRDMLQRARERVATRRLRNVVGLVEMDAESMAFADDSFDIAVAMFTATVVPDARRLYREMRRVVRPGGQMLFVNHFAAEGGLVFVNYRSSEAAAEAVVEACRAAGGQAVAMQGQLNFSRDMEREADRVGFGVMTEAGFGAEGASAVAVGTKRVKDSSKTMPSISFPFSFM
jgi:phosphatidylethanolamine/phosphatidyl-N-methylethanolamine N-methyltransferase